MWSGPDGLLGHTRATATVVRELFASAKRSVMIASYALDKGERARAMFTALARRMDTEAQLKVRLFVNVARPYGDTTAESVLLREFAETFRGELWPGARLPEVFHDPRALATDFEQRACLHAKCVVIDDERALVLPSPPIPVATTHTVGVFAPNRRSSSSSSASRPQK